MPDDDLLAPAAEMPGTNCVVLQEDRKTWLFRDPLRILTAYEAQDVLEQLHALEQAVEQEGLFAAGFLTYEAAAAFGLAAYARSSAALPLLWFGLYEAAKKSPCRRWPRVDYRLAAGRKFWTRRLQQIIAPHQGPYCRRRYLPGQLHHALACDVQPAIPGRFFAIWSRRSRRNMSPMSIWDGMPFAPLRRSCFLSAREPMSNRGP